MTDATLTSKEMDFGDYCLIEQKRYGVPNEMYVHKVIGRLESNAWVDVPVDAANWGLTERNHEDVVPVVAAICCGVVEREVRKYRASDCIARPTNETSEPQPCPIPEANGFSIQGKEIGPGIWGIGNVSWHPESGDWRGMADINGALCVVTLKVTAQKAVPVETLPDTLVRWMSLDTWRCRCTSPGNINIKLCNYCGGCGTHRPDKSEPE